MMMILAILILAVTFNAACAAQDTVFFRKRPTDGSNAMIFLEPSRQSHFYTWLNPVYLDSGTLAVERDFNKLLAEGKVEHHTSELSDIAGQYVPIYNYHDTFYLYLPSDNFDQYRLILSDSAIYGAKGMCPIDTTMHWDPPEFYVPPGFVEFGPCGDPPYGFDLIRSVTKEEDGSYAIRTIASRRYTRQDSTVSLADDPMHRGVSYDYVDTTEEYEKLFRFRSMPSVRAEEKDVYQLTYNDNDWSQAGYFVPVSKVRQFPLVVCWSDSKMLDWGAEEDGPFKPVPVPEIVH